MIMTKEKKMIQGDKYTVHIGNSVEILKTLPDNSVDSIVTDPPYGLSDNKHVAETIARWIQGERDFIPDGKGFMGKSWDSFVPPPALWDECLRVLKPGGHLLAFFGSRTQDIGALAIRLAGFEVRDSIAWMYGSGFPKSLDVSKAIDKAAGAEREILNSYQRMGRSSGILGKEVEITRDITAPSTPEAQQWEGWGTALKPAFEPIVVARKPLIGTVAENVLTHGTGALNIDGSRIGTTVETWPKSRAWGAGYVPGGDRTKDQTELTGDVPNGRWPANAILDEYSAEILDEQSDASRFFYVAKASKRDRNEGLEGRNNHPTVKPTDLMRYLVKLVTPPNGTVLDPFTGSGSTGKAAILEGFTFIGCELTEDYIPIIEGRLKHAADMSNQNLEIEKEALF